MTTIETHQSVTVRRAANAAFAWCPACLKEVEMVSLGEAALLAGVSVRDICRRVGADRLHFVETSDGLVCTNSLLDKASLRDEDLTPDGADVLPLPAPSDAADQ